LVGEKLPDHDSGTGLSFHSIQWPPAHLGNRGYLRLPHMTPSLMPSTDYATSLAWFVIAP
jgi:hypothetical protein